MDFGLLVIGENPEEQLQPFLAETSTDPQFICTEGQYRRAYAARVSTTREPGYDFTAYMHEHYGQYPDAGTGRYGYWANPSGEIDTYTLGGTYAGAFRAVPSPAYPDDLAAGDPDEYTEVGHGWYSSIRKGDIDFGAMTTRRGHCLRVAWQVAFQRFPGHGTDAKARRKEIYGILPEDSFAQYAERSPLIRVDNLIRDGRWYRRDPQEGCIYSQQWYLWLNEIMRSLPDDELLHIYHCTAPLFD